MDKVTEDKCALFIDNFIAGCVMTLKVELLDLLWLP